MTKRRRLPIVRDPNRWPIAKFLSGEIFTFISSHSTKAAARKAAARTRQAGLRARVVFSKKAKAPTIRGGKRNRWAVYGRTD